MIKLAIKNLWARRSSNIWLTIELVAVTIIAWMIIDPVVVRVYDATRPLGYDRDRLVQLWFSSYDSLSTRYDRYSADSATCVNHIYELQRAAGRLPQVESVTFTSEYYSPESQSINLNTIYGADTLSALESYFIPESRFLSTIGAKSVEGSPTVEELDNMHLGANDCIITQELAERAFPGENAVGKIVKSVYADPQRVVGVIGNMRFKGYMNSYLLTLSQPAYIRPEAIYAGGSFSLIVRLRPGESTARFIKDRTVRSSLNLGNFYCADIQSLDNLGKTEENNRGVTGSKIIGIGLLIFFMGSLTIGVTGIFWLQTQSRSREAGIMKSFGASPRFITGTMLWEGIILVAVTWLAGCLIYLQWGLANGLADHNRISVAPNILHIDWLVNFPIHFAVISAIVLVIMTVVVCAGICIPAVRISRVNPVDALHDE